MKIKMIENHLEKLIYPMTSCISNMKITKLILKQYHVPILIFDFFYSPIWSLNLSKLDSLIRESIEEIRKI